MKRAALVLVLLAACGGRVDAEPDAPDAAPLVGDWYGGACAPPLERVCSDGARGSYVCDDGGIAFYCCGYDAADRQRLQDDGDEYAGRCLTPAF